MLKDFKNFIRRMLTSHLIVPLTLGVLLFLALALARSDMWDGVIVDYASLTNHFRGIRRLTADTDLDSVLILFRFEIFIAKLLHVNFLLIDRIVLAIAFFQICSLLYRIVLMRFGLSERWSHFTIVLFLTFPVWHILTSSTQTFYFVLLALGMTGVDFLYRGKKSSILMALITLIMCFEMNSMILFAPALALVFEATQKEMLSVSRRLLKPFGIAILGIVYWIVSRSLSQPSGLYGDYNTIINPFSAIGWQVLKSGFTNYASFAILPLIGITSFTCFVILFASGTQRNRIPSAGDYTFIPSLVPLCFAAVLPYIVVQKSTFVDDFDWDGRHAIPLSIPASILVMLTTHFVFQQLTVHGRWRNMWKIVAVGLLIVPQSFVLMQGLTMKSNRQEFEVKLIGSLRSELIKPGIVEIVGLPIFVPDFRVYEANYLMYRAFGKAVWWTRIGQTEDPNFSVPDWIQRVDYQDIYIFQPPRAACRTIIQLDLVNYGGFWKGLKSILHLPNSSSTSIKSVRSSC